MQKYLNSKHRKISIHWFALSIILIITKTIIFDIVVSNNVDNADYKSNNIVVHHSSIKFNSDPDKPQIKIFKYKLFIHNNNNNKVKFIAKIKRPDADWYPYIESIPEVHYSEVLTLEKRDGNFFEINGSFNSKVNKITGGYLNDFEIQIISEEEYELQEAISN